LIGCCFFYSQEYAMLATTTKPDNKYRSIQNPRMYRALRKRGFSKTEAAMISNGRSPGHTVKADDLTLKAPNYGAHAGETIAGNLGRGQDGKFAAAGNASAAKPKKPRKPRAAKPKKPVKPKKAAKPKVTPEQRQAAQDAQKAKNRAAVQDTLKNGPNKEGWDTLQAMREGKDVDPGMAQALADETGLVEKDATGHFRLSTDGTHLLNAADRGDAGDANVAVSRGQDRLARQDAASQIAMPLQRNDVPTL
jgi:hypothetical protein